MKILSILPFLKVGNLLIVTVFEFAIIRDALVCIDGVVVTGFGVCDGVWFDPFPTITRRTVDGDESDRRLLIDWFGFGEFRTMTGDDRCGC